MFFQNKFYDEKNLRRLRQAPPLELRNENYRLVAENQDKLFALKDPIFKQQNLKISIEIAEKLKSAEQKNL